MTDNSSGYSTHVELFLILNGRQIELGQVGSEHCTLRHPEDFPPSQGEIVTIVDGDETRIPVFFPNGASAASRRVSYVLLAADEKSAPQALSTH
ncbi:MAG TPA: hypothetical protein VGI40_04925 [Pirellulaceae bacterium]|jgi:hypothetical protein